MKNFLLTCFLALLCLVGRYLAASDKVADSPTEVQDHRPAPSVSPHSGDNHREGETLPDTFTADNFGLISSDQDMGVGMEKEYFHSTSVPVFFSQNKQEVDRKAPESQSLGSWLSPLASKNGLVDSDQDMGAGEGLVMLQPAPFPVSAALQSRDKKSDPKPLDTETHRSLVLSEVEASVIGHPTPPQLSLELSGDECHVLILLDTFSLFYSFVFTSLKCSLVQARKPVKADAQRRLFSLYWFLAWTIFAFER